MALDRLVVNEIRGVVGGDQVLEDPGLTERYRRDWTGRFTAAEATVARPADTTEVAALVDICVRHEVAVVAQGGNTGLVGGSVPLSGELVISTERMGGVSEFTAGTGHLNASAGTSIAVVQKTAHQHGWEYAVDLAARDSATVGGTIATNAGGLRVARYGATRSQIVGVEFVTGTGEIVTSMRGTLRDNTGYHLPSIVCGSEGTLGILTRARLRLVPHLVNRTTALIRFADKHHAANSAESLHSLLPLVESIEFFVDSGLELVCSSFGFPPPFASTTGGYMLVEVGSNQDPTDELVAAVDSLTGIEDVAVAGDSTSRARLWRYRELHTEAIATLGPVHKLDVAVPPGSLAEFLERVEKTVSAVNPDAQVWLFGHGGESAVHVNVTGLDPADESVDTAVLNLVAEMGGSISAEHGIGRAKLPLLGVARSRSEIELLCRIKSAFDPAGIMNPAVLLPPTT